MTEGKIHLKFSDGEWMAFVRYDGVWFESEGKTMPEAYKSLKRGLALYSTIVMFL